MLRQQVQIDNLSEKNTYSDIKEALNYLKVPSETKDIILSSIPRAKATKRADSILQISDYYTEDSINIVNSRCAAWFELGGYTLCTAVKDLEQTD